MTKLKDDAFSACIKSAAELAKTLNENNKLESPINALQQLMVITAEECGELTQVAMKVMRKYDSADQIDSNWHTKLVEEAGDVLCMIDLMTEHGLVTSEELHERVYVKKNKLKKWSNLIT